jgi:drug/metabolite transporter (DMT)-like permease
VRRTITILMIVGGIALMLLSYFGLSAPWGNSKVSHSNPRMDFAPVVFLIGIMSVFLSAVVYEVLPDRRSK